MLIKWGRAFFRLSFAVSSFLKISRPARAGFKGLDGGRPFPERNFLKIQTPARGVPEKAVKLHFCPRPHGPEERGRGLEVAAEESPRPGLRFQPRHPGGPGGGEAWGRGRKPPPVQNGPTPPPGKRPALGDAASDPGLPYGGGRREGRATGGHKPGGDRTEDGRAASVQSRVCIFTVFNVFSHVITK